jgi:hypothetical protein
MNTQELQQDYEVTGFSAPYVSVIRKSDGVWGMLQFSGGARHGTERVYFGFVAA